MKKIKLKFLLIFLLLCNGNIFLEKASAKPVQVAVSFQFFYDELSPYGSWVSYPQYGYVWIPAHRAGFRPYYSNGHWVYTDIGWTWVSYYDWGWAPFHYGSWAYDSFYGWIWVPGYDWAPAWVEWGSYGGYYGWAPIGPGYSFGTGYYAPVDHWVFLHPRYLAAENWSSQAYVAHNRRISISNNTVITDANRVTLINNRNNYNNKQYFSGPQRQEIEKSGNTTLHPVTIGERDKPGKVEASGNSLNIYRPRIEKSDAAAKPAKVQPMERQKVSQNAEGKMEPSRTHERQSKEVYPIPERKQNTDRSGGIHEPNKSSPPVPRREQKRADATPPEKPVQNVKPSADHPVIQPHENTIQPRHQVPVRNISPQSLPEQRHMNINPKEPKQVIHPQQNFPPHPVERRVPQPPVREQGQRPHGQEKK